MAASGLEPAGLLVTRLLFGGVIAFMGLNHFLHTDEMTGYAQHKGLPAPQLSVIVSGAVLVLGGLGIIVGAFPLVSSLAVAGFLIIAAFLMHNFWTVPADQQQEELTQFLKNIVMASGALAIALLATQNWAISLGVGL